MDEKERSGDEKSPKKGPPPALLEQIRTGTKLKKSKGSFVRGLFRLKSTHNDSNISLPFNVQQQQHVTWSSETKKFIGLPPEWNALLESEGFTEEEKSENPEQLLSVLNFQQKFIQGALEAPASRISRTVTTQMFNEFVRERSGYKSSEKIETPTTTEKEIEPTKEVEKKEIEETKNSEPAKISKPLPAPPLRSNIPPSARPVPPSARPVPPSGRPVPPGKRPVPPTKKIEPPSDNSIKEPKISLYEIISTEDPQKIYEDFKAIGQGASGTVYVAKDKRNSQLYAIKKMVIARQAKEDILINEILTMRTSRHPNLVNFVESYAVDGSIWLSMEFVDGASLTQIITAHQKDRADDIPNMFEESFIAYVIKNVLQGLNYLHKKDIIHRDIKSDNILLGLNGDIKLTDFGYSAQLTAEMNKRISRVGTSYWMAPEVIDSEEYDTKCDIWSTGILTLEMVESEPPYMDFPPIRAYMMIVKNGRPDFRYANKMSNPLKEFIQICTERNSSARPACEELLKHPFIIKAESKPEHIAYVQKAKELSVVEIYEEQPIFF